MNIAIVIDTGSYSIKAGFANNDKPEHHIACLIGNPRVSTVPTISNGSAACYVGNLALKHRGVLRLRRPLEHGFVQNWDDLEDVWKSIYENNLEVDPADHPVLLSESPLNPPRSREKMLEIAMEKLSTPAVYIENTGKLALLSADIFTGVALDIGDGVTTAVPVYECCTISHGIQRNTDLIGRVHKHLGELLKANGQFYRESAAGNISRDIKEKCLRVGAMGLRNDVVYNMADGTKMIITASEAVRCTSHLFEAGIEDCDAGLHEIICKCIAKCDERVRDQLRGNVVVCGGTSLLPGLIERLEKELYARDIHFKIVKIKTTEVQEPQDLTWIGGAKLCRKWPESNWINRLDYEEYGSAIVQRYCF